MTCLTVKLRKYQITVIILFDDSAIFLLKLLTLFFFHDVFPNLIISVSTGNIKCFQIFRLCSCVTMSAHTRLPASSAVWVETNGSRVFYICIYIAFRKPYTKRIFLFACKFYDFISVIKSRVRLPQFCLPECFKLITTHH